VTSTNSAPETRGDGDAPARLASILTNPDDPFFMRVQLASIALVLISVGALMAETVEGVAEAYADLWYALEWVFLIGFGLEYLAYLYVARDRMRHVRSFWGIVDLLATLPSLFLVLGVGISGGFLRILRVLRVLRTLKIMRLAIVRYQQSDAAAGKKRNTLWLDLQIYGMAVFVALVLSAALVYEAEGGIEDTMFTDIPTSLWWAISILATHGSAFSATTALGKVISGLTMLTGVALFSILTNVIGRSLLATLFGEDSSEEPSAEARKAAEAKVRQAKSEVAATVKRVVDGASGSGGVTLSTPPDHLSSGFGRIVWNAFNDIRSPEYEWSSKIVTTAIFVSVATVMLESVESISSDYQVVIGVAELLVTTIFVCEYVAQLWIAKDRWAYARSFWGIIDFLAILPAILPVLGLAQVKAVKLFRILRVLRVLKLMKVAAERARASSQASSDTLLVDLQIYMIALFTAMVMSATLMWYAEGDVESNSSAANAFEGLWFAVVTLTATGSGVNVPQTPLGRFFAGATMIVGLALFGVLTSVIGRAMLRSLFGDDGGTDGDISTADSPEGRRDAPTAQLATD
jgi:voltage-gated potassium channel